MRYAFIEIGTLTDCLDLITLLRQGATVGVSARTGHLFGPMRSLKLEIGEAVKGPLRQHITETTPEGWLSGLMRIRRFFSHLSTPQDANEPHIRAAHTILNSCAGIPLTRLAILRLAAMLPAWVGSGRVEPQYLYGDAEWTEFVKDGMGHVVMPYRPSEEELQDIADFGAKGVIVAETATERFPWFAGMSGPYPMPTHAVIDYDPQHDPYSAYSAASAPLGLGETWDTVRSMMPLSGLLWRREGHTTDLEDDQAFKALGLRTLKVFFGEPNRGSSKRVHPKLCLSRPFPTIPREGAGAWVFENWNNTFRVDFSSDESR